VHSAARFLLQLLQFRAHPFARRLAPYDEAPLLASTVVSEPQEVEGLRFSLSTLSPVRFSQTPALDQSRFVWMHFQSEFRQPLPELAQKPLRVFAVLETCNQIVGVASDNHFALRPLLPPDLYPLIKDVMQVDVRQQR